MRLMRSALGAAMMVIILASIALTFDLNDLKKLKELNECVECDLS